MSSYPTWSFRVPLRPDLEPATLRVLDAVACDRPPARDDLATLHPVVATYLGDWTRMLIGEPGTYVGPPVRLSGLGTTAPCLTIEFSQHDDEHAGGGWVMWLWILHIAGRPTQGRRLIGHHGPSARYDDNRETVVVGASGPVLGDTPWTWAEVDETWRSVVDDPSWTRWRS
ncbi:hypothetical protein OMK64_13880 [Cellulomonas fimi]|uniref:hypothetical protein n=1 Tax=Cellulomonas fimi TaxID=1708 RepID=UPI00234C50DF|nr:hypothetical protein [Cellulomonas fimi]MDC7122626.1 hypothetical protein [Cellulomonas fimi]